MPSPLMSLVLGLSLAMAPAPAPGKPSAQADAERLVATFLGDTPLLRDLQSLTDEIGGRATGSPANLRSVEWALARFREAGIPARKESFTLPALWLERSARATVSGADVRFSPRVAAMPFSTATPPGGLAAPLRDAGHGSEKDFLSLGARAQGAFLLVETQELKNIDDLFREYAEAADIEQRAFAAGAQGVVYMGSRPGNQLYRHNVSVGERNTRPMLVMERDGALRAMRLLRGGAALTLTAEIELQSGPAYESHNVIGEIRGTTRPDEVVVMGAHLDSWDLGTGALDNGANVALLIDVARQMRRLGLKPARTLRFALWNGEEQGMYGSWGYTKTHASELDRHTVAASFDIGCGRITGFFTGGRPELPALVDRALEPVKGLGPFTQVDEPIVGTDNFDFMLQGVANLVANQEPALYGPNYHARSDELDKCDPLQLRLNAATVAALAWGFAQMDEKLPRQSRAQVDALIGSTNLREQMKSFNVYEDWANGKRGRQ
ncbi:M28 family peptidase [Stigmatella aurantiaca]|uniref:Carboxypeptidase Q n=1 Tax=Stigmatella aurantiaca (strain DW4/3-1) TaxID=378806 RepID=Q08RW8_STIAD|nr:M28 family peptidase [Stigmatella aurantiaca]ADO69102.1 Peptidase, M28D (Aminopeptidase ES-62) subfamily [Stigmatella aurantiaca DW4/3-1]EAU63242.1 peptidase M28 family protein [Stigmatella aurantiaca DW4/3-1]